MKSARHSQVFAASILFLDIIILAMTYPSDALSAKTIIRIMMFSYLIFIARAVGLSSACVAR
jgi:hypothetical protein